MFQRFRIFKLSLSLGQIFFRRLYGKHSFGPDFR
jgi:hypothetical protein